jgi:hypothetical protein
LHLLSEIAGMICVQLQIRESNLAQKFEPEAPARAWHEFDLRTFLLHVRMRSRRPSSQMPPLGTVIRDQQPVDVITAWIQRLAASGASR